MPKLVDQVEVRRNRATASRNKRRNLLKQAGIPDATITRYEQQRSLDQVMSAMRKLHRAIR